MASKQGAPLLSPARRLTSERGLKFLLRVAQKFPRAELLCVVHIYHVTAEGWNIMYCCLVAEHSDNERIGQDV